MIFSPLFCTALPQSISVYRHSYNHISLKVRTHYLNWVEVWTLTKVQRLDNVLLCLGLMYCYMSQFQPNFSCQADELRSILVYRRFHGQLEDCKVLRSGGCRTSPNHQPSTTVLNSASKLYGLYNVEKEKASTSITMPVA